MDYYNNFMGLYYINTQSTKQKRVQKRLGKFTLQEVISKVSYGRICFKSLEIPVFGEKPIFQTLQIFKMPVCLVKIISDSSLKDFYSQRILMF